MMKLEIVSEKDNPLRKRKRYWLLAEHAGKETPNRHELMPEVVKKLGSKDGLTVIDKIFSERGSAKSAVKVLVFKDKKDIPAGMLERQERKVKSYLEKKEKKAQEPEPAPEQPKDEAPAEGGEAGEGAEEEKPEEESAEEEAEKPAEEAEPEAEPEKPEEEAPAHEEGAPAEGGEEPEKKEDADKETEKEK